MSPAFEELEGRYGHDKRMPMVKVVFGGYENLP